MTETGSNRFIIIAMQCVNKRITNFVFCICILCAVSSSARNIERPRLVVGIVVDQMRWDYLYRYYERYGPGGFKRLMREGFNYQNTYINYLPSYTAPGHASVYTGSVPALHGIVANNWIDRHTGKEWYCTEDTTVKSIGGGKAGLMSPRNMTATTITDELRLATQFKSRTIGISLKDRGAILPAGHSATAAYWYEGGSGLFITSSFYGRDSLPAWLQEFNERNVGDSLMQSDWSTLYPVYSYENSTADNNSYEAVSSWETEPVFPHKTSLAKDKGAIRSTVQGNTFIRMMAEACISGEKLGQGNYADFLALSFSSPDYIGHQYGPNSIEIEDTYLRLDRELEAFLLFLDKEIGKGAYTVFLTADHGGAHNAAFLQDQSIPARSVKISEWTNAINSFLQRELGYAGLVKSLMNYQVHLNENAIAVNKLDREDIKSAIKKYLRGQEGVTQVSDLEDPGNDRLPAAISAMIDNGYYPKRSGVIQIIMDPAWYSGYGSKGTTHGSWNPYDTHIPLLWYGWGIRKGSSFRTVSITDIAPTLAALLHIQVPNACVGSVLEEVLLLN